MSEDIGHAAAVIIPTYNEARHIGSLLRQVLRQGSDVVDQVLVADGRSEDDTRAIVAAIAATDRRVILIDNPDRIQSAGINRAFAAADPACHILVRMDAHAGYPDDFVPRVAETLRTRKAGSVVVRLRTIGCTALERAIAAASNSRLGTGGAAHRIGRASGPVDHGHHAAFRRSAFLNAGGYDPSFVANEDGELDYRLAQQGNLIWFDADIAIDYYPRSSLRGLARQYYRYGVGRAQNYLKHRSGLRFRQMIPPALVCMLTVSAIIAIFNPIFLAFPFIYIGLCAILSIKLSCDHKYSGILLALPASIIMHTAWGFGFLSRITSSFFDRNISDPVLGESR
ncbi:glycosyltransferase family 2 protein [Sphingomonas sp. KC8]|uniref:glycosyltransferase family 2 protein n=1 Tax=Sphingomonas sp. KC8 TaxID=1030157 RepID=UPI0002489B77|nr:glycosyltransferase family 2 protein [Sphingomonas sp. KC8]ARS26159.1 succinoglycan biosynthesis protein exoa [Sphingomonas sp. KC8]